MSASLKQQSAPDAATLELWRAAETDDLEGLRRILPRVTDIDAGNRHGVTALMRAACHGHERIVRTLLDHGANPNLARNDKFMALTLAAFFGHAETVKILME
ncbi:MAG TPA: ankyrin repeat domain-containing protein, partial [Pyrinomonadaceae bacterium]|nr:ankyrin repeat domain-containing protein [Pyrinomonadaceae bacterium]